jgi:hypothetical protein
MLTQPPQAKSNKDKDALKGFATECILHSFYARAPEARHRKPKDLGGEPKGGLRTCQAWDQPNGCLSGILCQIHRRVNHVQRSPFERRVGKLKALSLKIVEP